jgi:hypothetical protein
MSRHSSDQSDSDGSSSDSSVTDDISLLYEVYSADKVYPPILPFFSCVSTAFSKFRTGNQFADVEIICSDGSVFSHKMVLSKNSKFIAKCFSSSFQSVDVILCPDLSIDQMSNALDLLYTGQTKVSDRKSISEIKNIFKFFGMKMNIEVKEVNPVPSSPAAYIKFEIILPAPIVVETMDPHSAANLALPPAANAENLALPLTENMAPAAIIETLAPGPAAIAKNVALPPTGIVKTVAPPPADIVETVALPRDTIIETLAPGPAENVASPSTGIVKTVAPPPADIGETETVALPLAGIVEAMVPPPAAISETVALPPADMGETETVASTAIVETVALPPADISETVAPPSANVFEPEASTSADVPNDNNQGRKVTNNFFVVFIFSFLSSTVLR